MTEAPLLNSRTIGMTENALRANLIKTLSDTGLDYHGWVALKLIADGRTLAVDRALDRMSDGLKLTRSVARGVIDALQTQGFVGRDAGMVAPTARGAALFARVNAATQEVAREIYAGLDAGDLATAHRVLSTLIARANARLAG